MIFGLLEYHRVSRVIPWRRLNRRMNPAEVLSVKDRIDVEGSEHFRCVYHRSGLLLRDSLGGLRAGWVSAGSPGGA